ncbi:Ribosomal large subunit pseudouridine synthase D [Jeotgalicoccus aerolatus]|uniref:Pseudouridine synthase n=1 Tax=Jeotgalicoccus aerolatus TaxID=709510 RepID=A0A1G8W636_9STAP|nr:RluA family pseudouridine synthase [Jeotgalicoccus aerolatus]MBP1951419.1 23S rRNA pseudouridine1911/1915/1917 synthase [Jeotgalicoccus aerolatus]NMA82059.1 RluA family pseudouridine synthase [Jeotgalicoccus aerolatus]CAD2076741.1 Ribosomal large subunit pseudouridine synthase D [Jeotgalicoccus aerolatus]SDJ73205.1 23S rRNA pseudouridine1911/1915/1917 synthase [Jeotgalicoccus aerolatus]GGD97654.1 pseudouridine synthase [Jeotgalicoccus aerolatus]
MNVIITEENAGERLDTVLAGIVPDTSRTDIQNRVKSGHITVNQKTVKPNYKVKTDDLIEFFERENVEADIVPEDLNLDIVYEDEDVAVVYKERGMVVHPAAGHASGTLVNGLMFQLDNLSGINGELRPGIVHRIDKDTSGLLMVAKNDVAHRHLVDQLVEKSVTRKYTALVHGVIPHNLGTIEAPIGRNPKERQDMAVVDEGKDAVTHFNVLERFDDFTLVECILETGRTHQIRVHMKYIGYPLAGDPKYGPRKTLETDGQLLHAGTLGFTHPKTGERLMFTRELPAYFTDILKELKLKEK